jgi:diguanylate cyclase (GGDEF)-like protein
MTSPAPTTQAAVSSFQAQLRAAEDLYMSDPAASARLAAEALAALGPAPGTLARAQTSRVRAFALGLVGQARQGLQELHAALDALDADLVALKARQPSAPLKPLHTDAADASPSDEHPWALDRMRAGVLRSLCIANDQLGDLHEALAWGLKATEAARALGDPLRAADVLQSMGVVRARLGDHATGLQHQLEALAAFEAAGRMPAAISSLCNVGICHKNLGRPAEAVDSLQRAVAMARAEGDEGSAMAISANLPEPLRQLGRLDEALDTARQARAHMQRAGILASECHCGLQVGLSLQALGDVAGAQAEMERALELAGLAGVHGHHHLPRVHLALYALHKQADRFDLALQHHEAFHAAERALFNAESARSMNALQVRFDLERARHEAEVERLKSAELAAMSQTDALTGLANRRHLDQGLLQETTRAQRLQLPLALAVIDIDNFKRVNDRYGHPTGDAVLRQVAQLLRQHCRSVDLCARYGGEEFCIVFVQARLRDARRACEAMRAGVAAHDWSALAADLQVTLSIGLAELAEPSTGLTDDSPQQATSELLAAADQQLYSAKRDGKNRVLPSD